MKQLIIISILFLAAGFSQAVYKGAGEIRLSPRLLNYQGYLTDTLGNPITNEAISMIFSIYDQETAGSQKWTETHSWVSVEKGIFSVLLGTLTPVPDSVFTKSPNRWLELSVAGQTLTPRTQIVSAPFAYTAIYSDTAQYARNFSAHNHLGEYWSSTAFNRALMVKIDRTSSSDVFGVTDSILNAGTGAAYGGYFSSGGTGTGAKLGVYTEAFGPSGSSNGATGLYGYGFHAGSGTATGVYGYGYQNGTGVTYGGQFWASGNSTNTKYGISTTVTMPAGSANTSYGTYGYSSHAGSGGNYGAYGYSNHSGTGLSVGGSFTGAGSGTGSKYGVLASSSAPASDTGTSYGANLYSSHAGSGKNYGVYAYSSHIGSGANYGAYGYSNNNGTSESYGGYFSGSGYGPGGRFGVYSEANAPSGSVYPSYGIMSVNNSFGTGNTYGGAFFGSMNSTGSNVGVFGDAVSPASSAGMVYGVLGVGEHAGPGIAYGGYFAAQGLGSAAHYGVYSTVEGNGVRYAGYFVGNHVITGTKSAAVKIGDDDWRLLYCQESPELWFEDFGEGQLQNGRAHIELEPVFIKTVTISAEYPMKVFVQLADDCNGVYVKRGKTGFDVIELKNGTSSAGFTYRVVAKRQGYEDLRLKKMEPGTNPDELRVENEKNRQRMEKDRIKTD